MRQFFLSLFLLAATQSLASHGVVRILKSIDVNTTVGEVELHASSEEIYRALTDYKMWPALFPDVTSAQVQLGGRENATLAFESKMVGHSHVFQFKNTLNQRVGVEAVDAHGMKIMGELVLESTAPNTTRVQMKLYSNAPGILSWFVSEKVMSEKRVEKIKSDLAGLLHRFSILQ